MLNLFLSISIRSLTRVINFKLPLQLHQKYYTTQYEELGFSSLTQMKDDYTILYIYSMKFGRMYFLSLGGKGLK